MEHKGFTLDPKLLESAQRPDEAISEWSACLNALGLYHTEQFVLRLSPRVHALLEGHSAGLYEADHFDPEAIQAHSTFLHETIHWWQHIGSTAGFIYSLALPAQCHMNVKDLRMLAKRAGIGKSIRQWAEAQSKENGPDRDPALGAANRTVNNTLDLEFYKILASRPGRAPELARDVYFESQGHCWQMAYGQTASILAATVDPTFAHLPGGPHWDTGFGELRKTRRPGFYHGGPIFMAPIGLHALFEGQARFLQLQYLVFAGGESSIAALREQGYLDEIYGEAFDAFLEATGWPPPARMDDPAVALFLLICDLAINPTAGFPLEIENFESFIADVDPGIRFIRLCEAARNSPDLRTMIRDYSREEYVLAGDTLAKACGYAPVLSGLEAIAAWASAVPGVSQIMAERETFRFDGGNLAVRILLSHFVAFSRDKLTSPEFFCWTGAWTAGSRVDEDKIALFNAHHSLFTDKADDDSIVPRLWPGKDEADITEMLNSFYDSIMVYDLTRQWILNGGPFRHDYRWLSTQLSHDDMVTLAKSAFEMLVGISIDEIPII
ncbi:MAG: hypothetical protein QM681_05095 [Novosphingobium sp.]